MSSSHIEKKIDDKQLHAALQSAFPTRQELETMTAYELKENLNIIANEGNLSRTIFELIRWAKSHGRLEQLLQGALNTRRNNPFIQAIAKQAGYDLSPSSLSAKEASTETSSTRETGAFYTMEIDTSTIFIARDKHIESFRSLIGTWQSMDLSTTRTYATQEPSPTNKLLGPVVIVFGEGGLGKSTLLRHYSEIASMAVYRINTSSIIDWEARSTGDPFFSIDQSSYEIDPCEYFNMLRNRLAKALNTNEKAFEEYEKVKKVLDDAADRVANSIKRMAAKDEYVFLRRLNRQTTKKVLQIGSSQNSYQALEKIKPFLGKNVVLQKEHLMQLVDLIKQKLGSAFGDYLQPAYCLGAALGTDLQLTARKDPILIFFDTYERILIGEAWLRMVMCAAGIRVGWVIASRESLWSGSQQMRESGVVYGYHEIVSHDRACHINLNEDGGSFTVQDILAYFENMQLRDMSLPAIGIEAAERILGATKGIPLVIQIVAKIYTKQRDLTFLREASGQTEIAGQFVDYYFRHVLGDDEERAKLYSLALLRQSNNRQAIMISLGFNQEQKSHYEKSLGLFQQSYSFLFTRQNEAVFHQYIRDALRAWLLSNRSDDKVKTIVDKLKNFYANRMNIVEEEQTYGNVQERLDDDEWVEAYLDLAAIHYWFDTREGVLYSLLFLLAAIGNKSERQSIQHELLHMGVFFHATMKNPTLRWWDLATQVLLTPLPGYAVEPQAKVLRELTQLLATEKFNCSSILSSHTQELEALAWWKLGKIYQDIDEYEALHWYEKAFSNLHWRNDVQEDILNIYWIRANSAYQKEEYEDSVSFLQEARTIKYDFADAYYSLGNVYYKLKDYRRAVFYYQYTIECDGSHFYAYVNLGNTYFAQKEYKSAIEEYSQSIKIAERDATIYYNRANAYAALKNRKESLRDFELAITLNPDFANAYLNSGHIYALQREHAKATTRYKQAYNLAPKDIQIAWTWQWANLTRTPISMKDLQNLDEIVALDEKHYIASLCRGILLWRRDGKLTAAQKELEQAQALEPEEWDPYFWQGMFFASFGQTEVAKEKLDNALKLDLPRLLLTPLYWLETEHLEFFKEYAYLKLNDYGL